LRSSFVDFVALGVGTLFFLLIASGVVRFDRLMRAMGANANPLLRGRKYELTEGQNRLVRAFAAFAAIGGIVWLVGLLLAAAA